MAFVLIRTTEIMTDLSYQHKILSFTPKHPLEERHLDHFPFSPFLTPSTYTHAEKFTETFTENTSQIVCFGTGGSALSAQTFLSLFKHKTPVSFLESIDPRVILNTSEQWDWTTTRFVFISKSGKTKETLSQMQWILHSLKNHPESNISQQCVLLSEQSHSPMRTLAQEHSIPILSLCNHTPGRFSAFTLTGLFPVLCAGGPALSLLQEAHKNYSFFQDKPQQHPATTHARWLIELHRQGLNISVLMPYAKMHFPLALWWRQLWAESLGKNGHEFLPVDAYGPFDQHSQLQLYLDGSPSKSFTFLEPNALTDEASLHSLATLLNQSSQATIKALLERNRPVRCFSNQSNSIHFIAGLMMHFMLETIIVSSFYRIDAFSQPAVELIKKHIAS